MAMFNSGNREPGRSTPTRSSNQEAGLSILAADARLTGEIETNGVIKIEGRVEGNVRAHGEVLVVKGGLVEGDIYTRQAVIGGEVRGGIFADERVEVQANSLITGDITTPRIAIQEGGKVNGNVRMENPQTLSKRTSTVGKLQAESGAPSHDRQALAELRKTG